MVEHYWLGAYWGPRATDRKSAAERASRLLADARRIYTPFENLHLVGDSIARPMGSLVPSDQRRLAQVLRTLPELRKGGFSLSVMLPGDAIVFHMTDGDYYDTAVNAITVSVLLSDPFLDLRYILPFMAALTGIYRPDYGVVASHRHSDMMDHIVGIRYASWALYLPIPAERVPPLPEGASIEEFEDHGVMIITTRERFTAENQTHVETAAAVNAVLEKAGLIELKRKSKEDNMGSVHPASQ